MTNKEIKDKVNALFKDTTDPETIKALGEVNSLIDTKDKEDGEFVQKYEKLVGDYRQAVMNAGLPPKNTPDESGRDSPRAKTLEQIAQEILKKGN